MTVWNQVGKKYIMVKLHIATRKLLSPTSTGIFCFRRNGARTGSGATFNSMKMNAMVKTPANIRGTITCGSSH